ncbi:HAD family hydrolase [Streptomyces sp. NPDC006510]|uniref:HAD family hydrolase n=1 Tax=Streptomyces sp. NPDC006510 TaxID=3155600 RepID=UPI0033A913B2
MSGPVPQAVLLDIGMTLIHPSGTVMAEELSAHGWPGTDPATAKAALAAAAEAHHTDFPRGLQRRTKLGHAWADLLNVDRESGLAAWTAAEARPDLYGDLDPEAIAVLTALRGAGITTVAVSNSDGTLDEELDRFGLLGLFDATVDSTAFGRAKPDSSIFTSGLERAGCTPQDAVFVGDGLINDVFGALAAGIGRTVLYDRHRVWRALPVPVIHRLGDLLPLVGC